MFDTEIVGPELYAFQNGAWQRTHEGWLDDVWYTYGYYFGTVSVDPSDVNTVYIAGVPLLKSTDGGQTFEHIGAPTSTSTTTRFGSTPTTRGTCSTATTAA